MGVLTHKDKGVQEFRVSSERKLSRKNAKYREIFFIFRKLFLQNFTYFPKKKCKIHKEMSQYCAIFSLSELFFAKQIIVKFRERNAKNVKIKMFFSYGCYSGNYWKQWLLRSLGTRNISAMSSLRTRNGPEMSSYEQGMAMK